MKKAILVVSFGTSYHETRKKTIEACENKIKESFKDYDFYRAFTSGMIINKLKKRDNMFIDNPSEALEKLYNAGYKEVVVQSLHIICGDEYNKLKDMVAQYEDKFDKISIGRPLLTYIDDYRETVEAVKKDLDKMDIDEAVVFMGHGTEHESHSSYPAIEYMFRDYGINAFVGTVEGYPELEQVIKKLKNRNSERNIGLSAIILSIQGILKRNLNLLESSHFIFGRDDIFYKLVLIGRKLALK